MEGMLLPPIRKAFPSFSLLVFLLLPLFKGEASLFAQSEYGLVPNGGFEDTASFEERWTVAHGRAYFEDSTAFDGEYSLRLRAEEGRVALFLDEMPSKGSGTYELSFWFQGRGIYREEKALRVELIQEGSPLHLFLPSGFGEEEGRRLRTHEWVLFSEEVRLSSSAPLKLFIHSDLAHIWLDGVSLEKKGS